MLGETVLNNVCPTAPQTTVSCLIDHATVRYDQMHGRFLIAMTVTDTGVQTIGGTVVSPRKASWVLIISQFSQFPTVGQTATSDTFICASGSATNCSRPGPNGTVTSVTGGLNKANWSIYYGGGDGFGGAVNGSINDIPALPPALRLIACRCYWHHDERVLLPDRSPPRHRQRQHHPGVACREYKPAGRYKSVRGHPPSHIEEGHRRSGNSCRCVPEVWREPRSRRTVDVICSRRRDTWRLLRSICDSGSDRYCSLLLRLTSQHPSAGLRTQSLRRMAKLIDGS